MKCFYYVYEELAHSFPEQFPHSKLELEQIIARVDIDHNYKWALGAHYTSQQIGSYIRIFNMGKRQREQGVPEQEIDDERL